MPAPLLVTRRAHSLAMQARHAGSSHNDGDDDDGDDGDDGDDDVVGAADDDYDCDDLVTYMCEVCAYDTIESECVRRARLPAILADWRQPCYTCGLTKKS